MKNKRILFISTDNNAYSGAFLCMIKLAKLLESQYACSVKIVLPEDGDGKHLIEKNSLEYAIIPSFSWVIDNTYDESIINRLKIIIKKYLNIIAILRIAIMIKREDINIVHINTTYGYVGIEASRITHTKCVWHLRELLDGKKLWPGKGIGLISQADSVIAISDCVYKKYFDVVPNLCIIEDGLDEKEYYFDIKKKPSNKKIEFLCVGNMWGAKGQDTVIEAVRVLNYKGEKGFHLSFVGTGDHEEEYKDKVSEYELNELISFFGATDNVLPFYQKADILIMPSKSEAFGRVTVEAMMGGCAVIGNDIDATPTILDNGKYGLLFNKNSALDLAEKMEYALSHLDKMKDLAFKGQKHVLERYSAETNAKKISKLYDRLLNE